MKQLGRILQVLAMPSRGFRAVLEQPRSWLVMMLLIGSGLSVHAAIQSRIDHDAMVRMTARQGPAGEGNDAKETSESDLEEQANRAKAAMNIMGYIKEPLGMLGMALASALIFFFVFAVWRKKVRLKNCWALSVYAMLPLAIWNFLAVPVILEFPSLDPMQLRSLFHADLAHLIGVQDKMPLLSWINPFTVWIAVLFAQAGKAVGRGMVYCAIGGLVFWLLLLGPQVLGLLGP